MMRPPYSATPNSVTPRDERVYAQLVAGHYYVVLADEDSLDWTKPGVPAILRNAMPPGFKGGVIMFHDGGGNRAETLAAVRRLIPFARRQGFRFVTVAQLAGLAPNVAMPPASASAQARGETFVLSVRAAYVLTSVSAGVLIFIAALIVGRTLLLFGFASHDKRRARRHQVAV